MTTHINKPFRRLAVSLSSRGFGYAVFEGDNHPVDYGHKVFQKEKDKQVLKHLEGLIGRYLPDVLVLNNVNAKGTRRALRIKNLHQEVGVLAKKHHLAVSTISNMQLRTVLLDDPKGTKQEMAETLATQFPEVLASRLPPKRREWESEDARMDIFDAFALAVVFQGK